MKTTKSSHGHSKELLSQVRQRVLTGQKLSRYTQILMSVDSKTVTNISLPLLLWNKVEWDKFWWCVMVCTEITGWFSSAVTRGGQLKQYCCRHNESLKLPKCSFCLTILRRLDVLQLVGIVFPFFRRRQLPTSYCVQWLYSPQLVAYAYRPCLLFGSINCHSL